MSEFQYYGFRAVDRSLTPAQMDYLRDLSTRADITPTSFVNTYNWGDFKGDTDQLIEEMFDAFLYVANWGARHFDLRLPKSLVDVESAEAYCDDFFATIRTCGNCVVVAFRGEEIYPEHLEDEEDGWMRSLLPLREDLLRGDFRCLYLAWLRSVQKNEIEDDECEPLVPAGLNDPSNALLAFADFFEIDHCLIEAAAELSPAQTPDPPRHDIADWIGKLPAAEKDELLCAVAFGEVRRLDVELLCRFRREQPDTHASTKSAASRRTAGELRAAAVALQEETARQQAIEAERERERKEAQRAAARAEYLNGLTGKIDETWDMIGDLIKTTRPRDYDQAVALLTDLRDLSVRDRWEADFQIGLEVILDENQNKPSFQCRVAEADLATR